MQISFRTESSVAQPLDKTAKEITKSIQQVVPGATVSVAKVNDTFIGFFSNVEREELSPSALLTLVKKMAPEGVVVDWNFKKAPEEVLKQHFLTPAPQNREIKLKGFEHLTPTFMQAFAAAQPNLRKIDLRKTKGVAKLLDAYLSRQQAVLSQSNQEVQKELRQKMARRSELVERRNDLTLKAESLNKEQENLSKEIEYLKDLAQKAHSAAKESPILEEYGKLMDQDAGELSKKLSSIIETLSQQTNELADLGEKIEYMNGAIDDLRSRFLDLDSIAVEILLDGSDIAPDEKRELHATYPHIILITEDTTLNLSRSRLSVRQVWDKLKRLPRVTQVDLTEHQDSPDLFDVIDLEEKFGVKVLYSPPPLLTPSKKISINGEFKPLSIELLSKVLRRFLDVKTVSLTDWKEATPIDFLCLEVMFPNIQFSFPDQERCEFPIFDAAVIEKLARRFPQMTTIQLKRATAEDEKQVLGLADHFKEVDFQNKSRVERILEDVALCKGYLKRSLRKDAKTTLSIEELRSLAIQRPGLANLIERIIGHRLGMTQTGVTSIQTEIKGIDFEVGSVEGKPLSSDLEIPYALLMLIAKFTSDVNLKHSDGRSVLMLAADGGHIEVAELLIEKGADVNLKRSDGWNVLMDAANRGHVEVAKLLIEKGVDVNLKRSDGWTALMLAANSGHVEMVKLFLERENELDHQDLGGWTALMLAANSGHVDVAKLLIERGADVNHKDLRSATPLKCAANFGHNEMVKLLLEKGADVNLKNSDGVTALMDAAYKGFIEIATLLIEKGADVNHKGLDGRAVLTHAEWGNHADMIELLKKRGAKK